MQHPIAKSELAAGVRLSTLHLDRSSSYARLFCWSSSSGLFNLLTPKISKSRVVFGCQTFLVIEALVIGCLIKVCHEVYLPVFFFSSPFLLTIYIDFVRMNSSFVTTWSNMVYRVSEMTHVMIMISISTSFTRECKCSWREVEGRRTFQQQLLNIPQICGRN